MDAIGKSDWIALSRRDKTSAVLSPLPVATRDRVIAVILGLLLAFTIVGAVARWWGGAGPVVAEESPRAGASGVSAGGTRGATDPLP